MSDICTNVWDVESLSFPCGLAADHTGPHQAEGANTAGSFTASWESPLLCASQCPAGPSCELADGHDGSHQAHTVNSAGDPLLLTWGTP